MKIIHPLHRCVAALSLSALSFGSLSHATDSDSIVRIDQSAALAGLVSPGDAPGFPVTLARSGHYRLAGDLVVPADTSGIVITAPGVALDLNGHTISGPVRCRQKGPTRVVTCNAESRFSAIVGISSVAAAGAAIRNGTVAGFAGLGVHYGEASTLDKLRVHDNAGVGIAGAAYVTAGVVRSVHVEHNGGPGIVCEHMQIEGSTFAANGGTGVDCRGAWFTRSITRHNAGAGVAEGRKFGLRSYGNRLGDEPGVSADRLPARLNPRR
jgi:hypothetical protein